MKCSYCSREWNSNSSEDVCPFCGKKQTKSNNIEINDVPDAIRYVISKYGIDVLLQPNVLSAYVNDLVEDHKRDKDLFRVGCNHNMTQQIHSILKESDASTRMLTVNRLKQTLMEDAFMTEANSIELLNMILEGVGLHELRLSSGSSPVSIQETRPYRNTNSENVHYQPKQLRPELMVTPSKTEGMEKKPQYNSPAPQKNSGWGNLIKTYLIYVALMIVVGILLFDVLQLGSTFKYFSIMGGTIDEWYIVLIFVLPIIPTIYKKKTKQ